MGQDLDAAYSRLATSGEVELEEVTDTTKLVSEPESLKGLVESDTAVHLYGDDDEYDEDEEESLCSHLIFEVVPNLRRRWKSIVAAILLLSLGTVFLVISILSFVNESWGYASSLLILAIICGLPGLYVFFVIYKVIRRDPDYDLESIPQYDLRV